MRHSDKPEDFEAHKLRILQARLADGAIKEGPHDKPAAPTTIVRVERIGWGWIVGAFVAGFVIGGVSLAVSVGWLRLWL